jgi:hypothetical protein
MNATYKIHPSIGIARLGNSAEFYLAPERTGGLPIQCNPDGTVTGEEKPVTKFKDAKGAIKRQAARFRVYVYDDKSPGGRELEIGETVQVLKRKSGQVFTGTVADITWTAYLANKKASWYKFKETEGEHGYAPDHPLRNASVTVPDERQNLIIDPGPQTVSTTGGSGPKNAQFTQGQNPGMPQSFPPPLTPNSIDTLGSIMATQQDKHARLVLLGAFGNSGSVETGLGQPVIQTFANNDGWFDDISDGPVTAQLMVNVTAIDGTPILPGNAKMQQVSVPVDSQAWAIVGYPRYAPEIVDIVTMDDLLYDLSVRNFAYDTYMYGVPPFHRQTSPPADLGFWRTQARWNLNYYPYFWRDIWPILKRPYDYQWVMDFDAFTGGDPHNTGRGLGGNMDPDQISIPPYHGENPDECENHHQRRLFVYRMLRHAGGENLLTRGTDRSDPTFRPYAMPYLCGDNPITNTAPSKFLRLTDTQLFILRQWADGKFINEQIEGLPEDSLKPHQPGVDLDRGTLGNVLGGAFCPGAEACWIMRNPAIYSEPYRILEASYTPGGLSQPASVGGTTAANLAAGLEPGDITKYDALPWQADFNECSTQSIDITYEDWNKTYPATTGDPFQPVMQLTYWWPAHRPMTVSTGLWSPTPQNHAGDLQMVTAWPDLGFVLKNPQATPGASQTQPGFVNVPSGNAGELEKK